MIIVLNEGWQNKKLRCAFCGSTVSVKYKAVNSKFEKPLCNYCALKLINNGNMAERIFNEKR